jgi:hypothetical protein
MPSQSKRDGRGTRGRRRRSMGFEPETLAPADLECHLIPPLRRVLERIQLPGRARAHGAVARRTKRRSHRVRCAPGLPHRPSQSRQSGLPKPVWGRDEGISKTFVRASGSRVRLRMRVVPPSPLGAARDRCHRGPVAPHVPHGAAWCETRTAPVVPAHGCARVGANPTTTSAVRGPKGAPNAGFSPIRSCHAESAKSWALQVLRSNRVISSRSIRRPGAPRNEGVGSSSLPVGSPRSPCGASSPHCCRSWY